MPKRRAAKKGEAEPASAAPPCDFAKKIGPPKAKDEPRRLERPDPEKVRPVVEAVA
jgi:hypothetical protein